jgi:hypothetical protein
MEVIGELHALAALPQYPLCSRLEPRAGVDAYLYRKSNPDSLANFVD